MTDQEPVPSPGEPESIASEQSTTDVATVKELVEAYERIRAQLGQIARVGAECIHEGPAHARGVWTKGRPDALRQPPARVVEVFEHTAACPVEIGAVFEDDAQWWSLVHLKARRETFGTH